MDRKRKLGRDEMALKKFFLHHRQKGMSGSKRRRVFHPWSGSGMPRHSFAAESFARDSALQSTPQYLGETVNSEVQKPKRDAFR
jgi:hypothetical protein